MPNLSELPTFSKLQQHAQSKVILRSLFEQDPGRFARFSVDLGDILFDYSKNLITDETMHLLVHLAEEAEVVSERDRMFLGERINGTEGRAVLHTALRAPAGSRVSLDGADVMPLVRASHEKMRVFSDKVRSGAWKGHTGKPMTDIVNIGIGGSDLGPAMASHALRPYWHERLRGHFVSNVDPTHLLETLAPLNPETTLFVVASKTFTTQETLLNAFAARAYLTKHLSAEAVPKHFVAVSTAEAEVRRFGIDPQNMFVFWDWVGGRYSMWSAIGLPIACLIGMDAFESFLSGAHAVDTHFREAPVRENVPMLMALLGVYYTNVLGAETHAVLPYDQHLARLPAYLQQADMESNGKGVTREGRALVWASDPAARTGPVVWGEPGTNGQHAFYQLIHQGTRLIPVDFLAPISPSYDVSVEVGGHAVDPHAVLLANCLAQSEALMKGKTEAEVRAELAKLPEERIQKLLPHKVFSGNRPSNTILYDKLTPAMLGKLVALYEHKIFTQGILWNVFSFDQWGVELGKQLAKNLEPAFSQPEDVTGHDASTLGLLRRIRSRTRAATRG